MERTTWIQVRLSPTEKQLISSAAARVGLSMSEYCRLLVLAGSKALAEGGREEDLRRAMNSTAGALSGLANYGGTAPLFGLFKRPEENPGQEPTNE